MMEPRYFSTFNKALKFVLECQTETSKPDIWRLVERSDVPERESEQAPWAVSEIPPPLSRWDRQWVKI